MSISARSDGTVEAIYILLRDERVFRTEEVRPDILLADYNRRGDLVGIEVLAPVKLSALSRLVEESQRRPFRRFVRERAPEELVTA